MARVPPNPSSGTSQRQREQPLLSIQCPPRHPGPRSAPAGRLEDSDDYQYGTRLHGYASGTPLVHSAPDARASSSAFARPALPTLRLLSSCPPQLAETGRPITPDSPWSTTPAFHPRLPVSHPMLPPALRYPQQRSTTPPSTSQEMRQQSRAQQHAQLVQQQQQQQQQQIQQQQQQQLRSPSTDSSPRWSLAEEVTLTELLYKNLGAQDVLMPGRTEEQRARGSLGGQWTPAKMCGVIARFIWGSEERAQHVMDKVYAMYAMYLEARDNQEEAARKKLLAELKAGTKHHQDRKKVMDNLTWWERWHEMVLERVAVPSMHNKLLALSHDEQPPRHPQARQAPAHRSSPVQPTVSPSQQNEDSESQRRPGTSLGLVTASLAVDRGDDDSTKIHPAPLAQVTPNVYTNYRVAEGDSSDAWRRLAFERKRKPSPEDDTRLPVPSHAVQAPPQANLSTSAAEDTHNFKRSRPSKEGEGSKRKTSSLESGSAPQDPARANWEREARDLRREARKARHEAREWQHHVMALQQHYHHENLRLQKQLMEGMTNGLAHVTHTILKAIAALPRK